MRCERCSAEYRALQALVQDAKAAAPVPEALSREARVEIGARLRTLASVPDPERARAGRRLRVLWLALVAPAIAAAILWTGRRADHAVIARGRPGSAHRGFTRDDPSDRAGALFPRAISARRDRPPRRRRDRARDRAIARGRALPRRRRRRRGRGARHALQGVGGRSPPDRGSRLEGQGRGPLQRRCAGDPRPRRRLGTRRTAALARSAPEIVAPPPPPVADGTIQRRAPAHRSPPSIRRHAKAKRFAAITPAPKPLPAARDERPLGASPSFGHAWALLRSGDAKEAAAEFAEVERLAHGRDIEEDALYWRAVAVGRAGDAAGSRTLFAAFLDRFPSSSRAGEAAATLGRLLLDAGDRHGARQAFERAARDPSPRVRAAAQDGLARARAE